MTEKKFTWEVIDHDALFFENGAMIDYDDVVDLLNELSEDINQYKILVESLKDENQKLKRILGILLLFHR